MESFLSFTFAYSLLDTIVFISNSVTVWLEVKRCVGVVVIRDGNALNIFLQAEIHNFAFYFVDTLNLCLD